MLNNPKFSDGSINSSDEYVIPVHKAFIRRYFSSEIKMEEFLQ